MTYRFYLAARDGDGLTRATAFRSRLYQYISDDGTQTFWEWLNFATPFRICLALCDSALHTTIAADPGVRAISPELADLPAIQTWLNGLVGTLPAGLATGLENSGIPLDWMDVTTTRRQLLSFISNWHLMVQRCQGASDANVVAFLGRNLDNTVAQVPVAARDRISAWMQNKSLDTSWIVGTTLVRAVVTFILQNIQRDPFDIGPVSL